MSFNYIGVELVCFVNVIGTGEWGIETKDIRNQPILDSLVLIGAFDSNYVNHYFFFTKGNWSITMPSYHFTREHIYVLFLI